MFRRFFFIEVFWVEFVGISSVGFIWRSRGGGGLGIDFLSLVNAFCFVWILRKGFFIDVRGEVSSFGLLSCVFLRI